MSPLRHRELRPREVAERRCRPIEATCAPRSRSALASSLQEDREKAEEFCRCCLILLAQETLITDESHSSQRAFQPPPYRVRTYTRRALCFHNYGFR
jgi:hypothetical protein